MLLRSIAIRGASSSGPFEGVLSLPEGSVVLSGRNGWGKSLAFSAVAWCLGIEVIFGVKRSDAGFFAEAARTRIQLNDGGVSDVLSSESKIVVSREDGAELTLTRSIAGGNPHLIRVCSGDGDQPRVEHNLDVHNRSQVDESAGFHAFLFRWLGMGCVKFRV